MVRVASLFVFCVFVLLDVLAGYVSAGDYYAFSLREAERQLGSGRSGSDLMSLGGVNIIAGGVYDESSADIIIVGQRVSSQPAATLDDLAVAMRTVVARDGLPRVSIDPTKETPSTHLQAVRFEGGIANTQYGLDFLNADILLKKLNLGVEPPLRGDMKSFLELTGQQWRERQADEGLTVGTRFWFNLAMQTRAMRARLTERPDIGVFAIRSLPIAVEKEVLSVRRNGKSVKSAASVGEEPADTFARMLSENFNELCDRYPTLARLRVLFSLAGAAHGIGAIVPQGQLAYWLEEYPIRAVETPKSYTLLARRMNYTDGLGRSSFVEVSGGISIRAILLRLKAGEPKALREAVLGSRPQDRALTWPVPINDWQVPWASSFLPEEASPEPKRSALGDRLGAFVSVRSGLASALPAMDFQKRHYAPPPPPFKPMPLSVTPMQNLPWQGAGRIGGVMLANTARVEGLNTEGQFSAAIDEGTGSFNLISGGRTTRLANIDARKFVTALWAVYFGKEDPGISIDPISLEAEQQLVRFIGNIVGSSLGKTLLDADYYMKKAAVGTVRPVIFGFRSVDDLIGRHGIGYPEVGRRFWFVPKDMRFRRAGNALLFEGGRMALLTEKLFLNADGATDASDQAFAQFWTDHYWEFAAANPVYEELFEYAKLTALAKYLKESGVGLQWFLLANRHLVLRDSIPGSVPALRAPSSVLRGVEWVGGVNLATDMSAKQPGRYIIDEGAAAALQRAYAAQASKSSSPSAAQTGTHGSSTLGNPMGVPTQLDDGAYTIVPARTLSGVTNNGGLTFHTDIALRADSEPGVELIRYHSSSRQPGIFGAGWNLYIPYGIVPADDEMVKATEVEVQRDDESTVKIDIHVPKRMLVVDRLDGHRETLVYDDERFGVAAWVPPTGAESRFEGMAYLTDGSCLLFETTGARFGFDAYTRPTDVVFSATHAAHLEYEGTRLVRVRDGFGGKVDLEYDRWNRVARAVGPFGPVKYTYLDNELARVSKPNGHALSLIYRRDGSIDEVVIRDMRRTQAPLTPTGGGDS